MDIYILLRVCVSERSEFQTLEYKYPDIMPWIITPSRHEKTLYTVHAVTTARGCMFSCTRLPYLFRIPIFWPCLTGISLPLLVLSKTLEGTLIISFLVRTMIVEPPYLKNPFSSPRFTFFIPRWWFFIFYKQCSWIFK